MQKNAMTQNASGVLEHIRQLSGRTREFTAEAQRIGMEPNNLRYFVRTIGSVPTIPNIDLLVRYYMPHMKVVLDNGAVDIVPNPDYVTRAPVVPHVGDLPIEWQQHPDNSAYFWNTRTREVLLESVLRSRLSEGVQQTVAA